jgi:hypothetical protein
VIQDLVDVEPAIFGPQRPGVEDHDSRCVPMGVSLLETEKRSIQRRKAFVVRVRHSPLPFLLFFELPKKVGHQAR